MKSKLKSEFIYEVLELLNVDLRGYIGPHRWCLLSPRLLTLILIHISSHKLILKEGVKCGKIDFTIGEYVSLYRKLLND